MFDDGLLRAAKLLVAEHVLQNCMGGSGGGKNAGQQKMLLI
jgi:hypothetical protein